MIFTEKGLGITTIELQSSDTMKEIRIKNAMIELLKALLQREELKNE